MKAAIPQSTRQKLMTKIIDKLAASIDHAMTLQEVAKLIVPEIADYTRIVVLGHDNKLKEIAVNHTDPTKIELASELYDFYKGRTDTTHGIDKILKSGKPEIIGKVDESVLSKFKKNTKLIETIKKIGLKSYMGVPLIARGKIIGAITFSSIKKGYYYTEDDLKFVDDIALRIALVIDNSRLYRESLREIAERRTSEKRLQAVQGSLIFLAEASKILSSSLDYKTTLRNVAKLAIPHVADWYAVDMLSPGGKLELIAVSHKDPKKVQLARKYRKEFPPNLDSNIGVARVLKEGKSEFYPKITEEMIDQSITNKKELEILKRLGIFTSIIIVPLTVDGRTLGTITFVASDSKRNYTKADLSMAEQLASRAALAIQNAKLYSDAKKAISIRDEFISVASHELKTPITSLKLYTQVLAHQYKNDSKASKYLDKMDDQITKLSLLVGDLLNVTKIRHGKMELKMEKFNISEILEEAIDILSSTTNSHKIIVRGKLNKKVEGDRYRLYQVITNILTNAIKYSPRGKEIIVNLSENAKEVKIAIRDFGIGIDKKDFKKIFSRFYRVTDPEGKTFPGLGIGLYIASEIVKRHGGKISVTSNKNEGSEFSFTIPFKT